jgi:chromosome segregation ATPase
MTPEDTEFIEKLFRSLETEMIKRFDQVNARFEGVNARLDRANARLDRIGGALADVQEMLKEK